MDTEKKSRASGIGLENEPERAYRLSSGTFKALFDHDSGLASHARQEVPVGAQS